MLYEYKYVICKKKGRRRFGGLVCASLSLIIFYLSEEHITIMDVFVCVWIEDKQQQQKTSPKVRWELTNAPRRKKNCHLICVFAYTYIFRLVIFHIHTSFLLVKCAYYMCVTYIVHVRHEWGLRGVTQIVARQYFIFWTVNEWRFTNKRIPEKLSFFPSIPSLFPSFSSHVLFFSSVHTK